jgi:hypothetical protein
MKVLGAPPLAADHHVVARLVPVVVVVLHAVHLVFPAPGDVEVRVQEQEAARPVALRVAEHGNHDVPVGQAVDGVRRAQVGLRLYLLRLDDLVQLGRALLGGVQDVDTAGAEAGTTRNRRDLDSSPWQEEQAFQPKWCSSSSRLGMGVRWMTWE